MANVVWTGNAQAIAQYSKITISGAVAGSELIEIFCNGKKGIYTTIGGDTNATIAAALTLALAALTDPEFQEIAFSNVAATAVVDCYARTPGVPFTITRTVTGGTVAATITTPTASAGPKDATTVGNYSTGALPSGADDFTQPPGTGEILYGIATAFSALTLGTVTLLDGQIGLPNENPAGYTEYRGTSLILGGATALNVGDGISAPTFCRVKVNGSGTCLVKIDTGAGVAADVNNPSTLITSGGTETLTITVDSGAVGLAMFAGEAATVGSIKVGTGGPAGSIGASDEASAAAWGTGAAVTACTLYAGEVRAASSTALTQFGGTYTVTTGNIGAVTNRGGTLAFNSNGTMGALTFFGDDGVLDLSGDSRAITSITSLSCTGGAYFVDPQARIPTSTAVALDDISYPLCVFKVGTFTLTRT